jgi:hypothetical protein
MDFKNLDIKVFYLRSEILMSVNIKSKALRDVTLCSLVLEEPAYSISSTRKAVVSS